MATTQNLAPNDWLTHPELLPPRPQTFVEAKYTRLFAVDIQGRSHHDQYVFLAPNGLAVVGLAPSHPLIAAHRRATGYQPLQLQYIPPRLEHLAAEELAAVAADEDVQEDADAGQVGQGGAEDSAPGESMAAAGESAAQELELLSGQTAEAAPSGRDSTAAQQGQSGCTPPQDPSGPTSRGPPDCEPFPLAECAAVNLDPTASPSGGGGGGGGGGRSRGPPGGKMSGKKRHRVAPLPASALLARVERRGAAAGEGFPVWAVAGGQLLELNQRLATQPQLLYDRPCREGYVALLFPPPDVARQLPQRLLSEADYLRLRGLTAEDLLM